jgi:hypothetical protein
MACLKVIYETFVYIITHPYPGGDIEPEILFTYTYDHKRWKIA